MRRRHHSSSGTTRSRRTVFLLHLGLALTIPFLAAPYFKACFDVTHGALPSACEWGTGDCPDAEGGFEQQILDRSERRQREIEATSVVTLGPPISTWADLEECFPSEQLLLRPFAAAVPVQPDCDFGSGPQRCWCYYHVSNPASPFQRYVRRFIAAPDEPECDGGRVGTIQISPIFIDRRAVPAYLRNTAFSDERMAESFARLWDAVSEFLAEFNNSRIENGRRIIDVAQWDISIGNEIDAYLNAPEEVDGGPDRDPAAAWGGYSSFFRTVSDYVRGRDPFGDGNRANPAVLRAVGFTTRIGGHTGQQARYCGPDSLLEAGMLGLDCRTNVGSIFTVPNSEIGAIFNHYRAMMQASTRAYFTFYPYWSNQVPDTPTREEFFEVAQRAFQSMEWVTRMQSGHVGPIVIQEIGFPTMTTGTADAERAQQLFAEAAWDAFLMHNERFPSLGTLIEAGDLPLPVGGRPTIAGFNWFNLHDFTPQTAPEICDDPDRNFANTFCSTGLIRGNSRAKLAWEDPSDDEAGLVPRMRRLNPHLAPLDRSCNLLVD